MSIIQLKNGKFRLQIRRKGYPTVDKVFASKDEALLRQFQPSLTMAFTAEVNVWLDERQAHSDTVSCRASRVKLHFFVGQHTHDLLHQLNQAITFFHRNGADLLL